MVLYNMQLSNQNLLSTGSRSNTKVGIPRPYALQLTQMRTVWKYRYEVRMDLPYELMW